MGHLLYLMFRCDRGCDGKFGKFGNFVGTKHTLKWLRHTIEKKAITDRWNKHTLLRPFHFFCAYLVLMTKIGKDRSYVQSVWPVDAYVVGLARPTCLTGGSDRSKQSPNTTRIFIDLDFVIEFLVWQVHPPYKYRATADWGIQSIKIQNKSTISLPLLLSLNPSFSNPVILCSFFVFATSEDVLGGPADPRTTLRAPALTRSLPG